MLAFTKETQIAIEMVNMLGAEPITVAVIAAKLGFAESTVMSVARGLQGKGFIKSVRGTRGGFVLEKTDLKLLDILTAFYQRPALDLNTTHGAINNLFLSVLANMPITPQQIEALTPVQHIVKPSPLSEEEKTPLDVPTESGDLDW